MEIAKFFSFDGRVGRGVFWVTAIWGVLVAAIGEVLIWKVDGAGLAVGLVICLLAFLMSLASQVKRWHDRGKSGWWMFIALVPVIGGLWAFIETGFLPGTDGPNQYGMESNGSPFEDSTPQPTQMWIN